MALTFNVADFQSVIQKRGGLVQPNRYSVYITNPEKLYARGLDKDFPLLIEATSLPSRSMATADNKTYGPLRKIARESIYADLSMTFILTQDMVIKNYFDNWLNLIQTDFQYDPSYYDDYTTDIYMALLPIEQHSIIPAIATGEHNYYTIKIEEAFPISVGDIALSSADVNTYAKLQVTFAYRRWINAKSRVHDIDFGASFGS